jgi:hypothetical protein
MEETVYRVLQTGFMVLQKLHVSMAKQSFVRAK